MGEQSDAQVIAASRATPREFGVIFERHFAPIYRYLARRLGRGDADDLSGEVFRIAFESRARFDTSYDSALPWLYGIAANLVLKHRRKAGRGLRALARLPIDRDDADTFAASDARLDALMLRPAMVDALRGLSGIDRELVILATFEELTYAQLAQATGLAEGTIKSKLSRAKARLRERLGAIGENPPTRSPAARMEGNHE